MKIGILTLPISENYGGILQAVALYRLLHAQGHDVVLIYKRPYGLWWKKLAIEILKKIPFHDYRNIKTNYKATKAVLKRKAFHRPFIENEIFKISKDLYTKKELENFASKEKFDAVVVGSDQVWRKKYINDAYYKSYFLDFVNSRKSKKIAYAASFGKDRWEGEGDSEEIAKLLQDFTAVSTREASSVEICKSSFGYADAVHVLDPTLLMSKGFYTDEMIVKYDTSNIPKGRLVTYVLDEANEKKEIIEFVQKNTKLESIHHLKGFNSSQITYSVPQWIASFDNADFVVTDSFHGMVFSIIFEKEFVVIGNHNRGLDRFTSLLSLLGLEDRLVFDVKDLEGKELESIDYSRVNKILEEEKRKSLEFLMGALDDK
ncbi:polysaccharide pyruvyl transferase family protein [Sulfurovum mangrovi]|uniref:polysaccharide pyruvyl transferase family protein n=1 Tax=Sulfurovum mangrovi TaxID=2893889 RepID=UPI001E62ED15|nr:polysaccharide pyruvyl transferase family protein [Sulfurovum mangrovi]UFH59219.1 polysaccharide pyruvyl transferase family protein [Sulfurovum mangrovi]